MGGGGVGGWKECLEGGGQKNYPTNYFSQTICPNIIWVITYVKFAQDLQSYYPLCLPKYFNSTFTLSCFHLRDSLEDFYSYIYIILCACFYSPSLPIHKGDDKEYKRIRSYTVPSHVHTNARLGLDPGLKTMTESVLIIILLPIQFCLVHRPENTPLNKSINLLSIRPWTVDARDEFSLNTYGTYYTEFNLHVLREDTSVLVYFSLPGYHVFM